MNYTGEYIRAQLAKYITKYMDTAQVVAGDFLKAKGLIVEDYLLHISQPGNRADELTVYLISRFCQRYIAVITKDTVWFTRQDTSIEDCPIVLVYLGGGTFHDTKSKVGKCFRQLPTPMECEESDSDFVYDLESPWGSPVPHRHTRSMGTPSPQLSPSGAGESSAESSKPEDTPPKPKSRRPRKLKCIVVKEKVYKIRRGARQSCKQCEFCKQKFDSQKELNSHVSGVYSFHFLCKKKNLWQGVLFKSGSG